MKNMQTFEWFEHDNNGISAGIKIGIHAKGKRCSKTGS